MQNELTKINNVERKEKANPLDIEGAAVKVLKS
jgi:hypothetical protein